MTIAMYLVNQLVIMLMCACIELQDSFISLVAIYMTLKVMRMYS